MRSVLALLAVVLLVLQLAPSSNSLRLGPVRWISITKALPKAVLGNALAIAVAFQGDMILQNTLQVQPSSSIAVAAETKSILEGKYNDPNHPGCLRKISVKDGAVTIIGSDNVDGSNQWVIKAKEDAPGVMFVDFSSKGGPSDLLGVYNEKADGIKWPDGNMWTKIKGKA